MTLVCCCIQAGFKTLEGFKEQSQIRICVFQIWFFDFCTKRPTEKDHNWFQMSLVPSLPYQVLCLLLRFVVGPSNFQQRCTWKALTLTRGVLNPLVDDHHATYLPHKIEKRKTLVRFFLKPFLPQKLKKHKETCWSTFLLPFFCWVAKIKLAIFLKLWLCS
jgi:hypothetical protein